MTIAPDTTAPGPAEPEATPRRGRKPSPYTAAFDLVRDAVKAAHDDHGQRDHPLHGGQIPAKGRTHWAHQAQRWSDANAARHDADRMGWDGLLVHDLYTALGTSDPAEQTAGLAELAATAIHAIAALETTNR
ncbi:hypothetical protein [Kribbella deserti]|uniref:dATP/dGTP diphosphohydrolase N-terminal domain-containing protein n=1 Tax=Kribbella deserti TaxID=1926257 RepID=A0ABV6QDT3_9ACTN